MSEESALKSKKSSHFDAKALHGQMATNDVGIVEMSKTVQIGKRSIACIDPKQLDFIKNINELRLLSDKLVF